MMHRLLPLAPLVLLSTPTLAQDGDGAVIGCDAPATQAEMTLCARKFYRAAEEDLELAYDLALSRAESLDEGLRKTYGDEAPDPTAVDAVTRAQEAWNAYMDRACTAESYQVWGGSMAPVMVFACRERLTRQRIEDLRVFSKET